MKIYSENINRFLNHYLKELINILKVEVKLQTKRTRFLFNGYFYPVNLVLFEHASTIGYFDSRYYQIGLNKILFLKSQKEVIKNILRHEFAHYLCYLKFGDSIQTHGIEYRDLCKSLDWQKDVFAAKVDLEVENSKVDADLFNQKIIEKIKKLMSLADSSNQHESEQATVKANQLMLKYNLERIDDESNVAYVEEIFKVKKINAKLRCISEILHEFYVFPIFNYGKGEVTLEVTGLKENIEIAVYVANFLDTEFERLWRHTKKANPHLKGISKKNSFMRGISIGYKEKIKSFKSSSDQRGLIKIENNLNSLVKLAFKRFSKGSISISNECGESKKLGKIAGNNLTIHPAVKSNFKPLFLN